MIDGRYRFVWREDIMLQGEKALLLYNGAGLGIKAGAS